MLYYCYQKYFIVNCNSIKLPISQRQPFSCIIFDLSTFHLHFVVTAFINKRALTYRRVDTNICKYICTSYHIRSICGFIAVYANAPTLSHSSGYSDVLTFKWRRKKKKKLPKFDTKLETRWTCLVCSSLSLFFLLHIIFILFPFVLCLFFFF